MGIRCTVRFLSETEKCYILLAQNTATCRRQSKPYICGGASGVGWDGSNNTVMLLIIKYLYYKGNDTIIAQRYYAAAL